MISDRGVSHARLVRGTLLGTKYHHSVLPPCEGIPLSTAWGRAWLPACTSSLPTYNTYICYMVHWATLYSLYRPIIIIGLLNKFVITIPRWQNTPMLTQWSCEPMTCSRPYCSPVFCSVVQDINCFYSYYSPN